MNGGFEPISDIINRIMSLPGGLMPNDTMSDYTITHLHRALEVAHESPDPATQVGAVITTPSGHGVIAWGCNRFPYGIQPTRARLYDRATKLRIMVHAELNAIMAAARGGRMTSGSILYLACTDETGAVWGGTCCQCACHIIQSGIRRVVTFEHKPESKWANEWLVARSLLAEADIAYVEVPRV